MGGLYFCAPWAADILQCQIDTFGFGAQGDITAEQQFQPLAIRFDRQQHQDLIRARGPGAALHMFDEIQPQGRTDTRGLFLFVTVTVADQREAPGARIPMDVARADRHVLYQG